MFKTEQPSFCLNNIDSNIRTIVNIEKEVSENEKIPKENNKNNNETQIINPLITTTNKNCCHHISFVLIEC